MTKKNYFKKMAMMMKLIHHRLLLKDNNLMDIKYFLNKQM